MDKIFIRLWRWLRIQLDFHDIASKNDNIDDLKRSIDAWDRIAKYTEPKLKAVDYYPGEDQVVNVVVKRFDRVEAVRNWLNLCCLNVFLGA